MTEIVELDKILHQLADPNTPDSSVSCLQTDFVRLIKSHSNQVFQQADPDSIFETLASQLTSQVPKIRANTFRCLTLSLPTLKCDHVQTLNIDLFLVRAIDTGGGKDGTDALEGVEALKLVYNMTKYGELPRSILFCLLSLVRATTKENYKKCATAIVSCYALTNPKSFIECGGVKCLLEAIASGGEYQETEALCHVFMSLYNHVTTRNFVHLQNDMGFLVACLSDPYFILFEKKNPDGKKEVDYTEDREKWLNGCKNVILSVCRTWPGLYTVQVILKEMMGALKRPFPKIQRTVVSCIYDLLHLKQPTNVESFEKALSSIIDWQQYPEWSITEDWVVGEAEYLLSPHHIEKPNIVDIHQATLLALILSADPKLDSVTHVAINGNKEEAILAAILVGELLHLINKFNLSSEQHIAHIQPLLVEAVSVHKGFGVESSLCITKLLNHRHRQGPFGVMSYQLKLIRERVMKFKKSYYPHYQFRSVERDSEHEERQHYRFIEKTNVLSTDDVFNWDWKTISSVLELGFFRCQQIDEMCTRFLKKIMEPFSEKLFLVMIPYYDKETGQGNSSLYTGVGIALMNLLLEIGCSNIEDLKNLIPDFLNNMSNELKRSKVGSGIFSVSNIRTTLVSDYFFMIGTLYSDVEGNKYLKTSNIFETYIELFDKSPDKDIIMKCVLVSMLYGKENITDAIFNTILHRGSASIRVFAIKFLRTLIRTGYQNFEKFILPMLVSQLYAYNIGESEEIVDTALSVLTEACQDQDCLERLFDLFPSLVHLGEKGYQLVLRFLSIPKGYNTLSSLGFLDKELSKWKSYKTLEYVRRVEICILSAMTGYEPGEAVFRSSEIKLAKHCFTPVHLYGEMAQFDTGINRLQEEGIFSSLDSMLTSNDILEVKAAAWAIGHIGSSRYGFAKISQLELVSKIHTLAAAHENLSVRGTCVYVMSLICKTESGCVAVEQCNFAASRKDFIHYFSICQSSSKKSNTRFSPGSITTELPGNRQRSCTLQPPRVKTHAKNRSLGDSQLNLMMQQAVGSAPGFECKETQPGEKIGLCVPNDIQKFFTLDIDFERPSISDLALIETGDEDLEQLFNLVICLSSTLRASTYSAELEELAKSKKYLFADIKNYITVHQLMSRYKYRQGTRRFIHRLFDVAVKSSFVGAMNKSPSLSSISSTTSANILS